MEMTKDTGIVFNVDWILSHNIHAHPTQTKSLLVSVRITTGSFRSFRSTSFTLRDVTLSLSLIHI